VRRLVAALALSSLVACSGDPDPSPSRSASVDVAEGMSWSEGPELRTPRTEVAIAASDVAVYAVGGFTSDGEASTSVEILDLDTGRWSDGPDLPEPLHHAGAVFARGVYVIGGYRADGSPSDAVWFLPPGGDGWDAQPDLPTPRGALAVAFDRGTIHAVGGASAFGGRARLSAAHEVFDPQAGRWERLAALPEPRDHLAAAALDGNVYVVGGRKLSLTTNTGRMDVWDGSRWSRGPEMPTARGGLAAAAGDGRVFVFGGEQPQGTFPEAEVYDEGEDRWSRAPDLPTPRHGLGAATVGNRVYVVGGGPTPGLSASGATEILQLEP
jgi:N-acetylneuraminic acid mutarotase